MEDTALEPEGEDERGARAHSRARGGGRVYLEPVRVWICVTRAGNGEREAVAQRRYGRVRMKRDAKLHTDNRPLSTIFITSEPPVLPDYSTDRRSTYPHLSSPLVLFIPRLNAQLVHTLCPRPPRRRAGARAREGARASERSAGDGIEVPDHLALGPALAPRQDLHPRLRHQERVLELPTRKEKRIRKKKHKQSAPNPGKGKRAMGGERGVPERNACRRG